MRTSTEDVDDDVGDDFAVVVDDDGDDFAVVVDDDEDPLDDRDSEVLCDDAEELPLLSDLSLLPVTDAAVFFATEVIFSAALPPLSCEPPLFVLPADCALSACATPVASPSRRKAAMRPRTRTSRRVTRRMA